MERVIEPEWLDTLPADDPRARRSRKDLRRINWFMNNAGLVARALEEFPKPKRILDVGAGDGAFALQVVSALQWHETECVLVDRNGEISSAMHDGFRLMGNTLKFVQGDALMGFQDIGKVDAAMVNLFLHHFADAELKRLLADIASRCQIFVACEPRRSRFGLLGSRCVGLLGCNDVTRHDAVASVRAGFAGNELSQLWPTPGEWSIRERAGSLFSHLFVAQKL